MSHWWMGHVTRIDPSCHTPCRAISSSRAKNQKKVKKGVMSHIWMRQNNGKPKKKESKKLSCNMYERVMSHTWLSQHAFYIEYGHMFVIWSDIHIIICSWYEHVNKWITMHGRRQLKIGEPNMSHKRSPVPHMNESCHTHGWGTMGWLRLLGSLKL